MTTTIVEYTAPGGLRWLILNGQGEEVERFTTLDAATLGVRRMWLLYLEGTR